MMFRFRCFVVDVVIILAAYGRCKHYLQTTPKARNAGVFTTLYYFALLVPFVMVSMAQFDKPAFAQIEFSPDSGPFLFPSQVKRQDSVYCADAGRPDNAPL
jgi:hypothetical protein